MSAKQGIEEAVKIEDHRKNFRQLILQNPNYFGNITQSPFKPVLKLSGNTQYEELSCVGFQPQLNLLSAIVYIKLPYGFDGDICTAGSQEYVRFYFSHDGGKTWTDLGVTSFTAYDVPEPSNKRFERLEYAVTVPFNPRRRFCRVNNFAVVRAILSWNVPPPPNDPNFPPVWGNVHDTTIKIDPIQTIKLNQALKELDIKPTKEMAESLDLGQNVDAAPAKQLGLAELQALYAGKQVEPHRFGLLALNQTLQAHLDPRIMSANFPGAKSLLGSDFDIKEALTALANKESSTAYEQMECIGFNENTFAMEAVVRIKRPYGYNGGACTHGSREYITFWADIDLSGAFATCLGTASVNVCDVGELPKGGLEYAVELPTTLFAYRQPCSAGPRLIPIRAILSWQVAPPCGNPNYVPVWGNREQTLICLPPGPAVQQGTQSAFFDTVGSMSVTKINSLTGLADGPSTVGFTAVQSPFGGEVTITGYIYPASNLSAGAMPFKYRISVSNDGGVTWTPLVDNFSVSRQRIPWGGVPAALPDINQAVDTTGITANFYTYQADWTTGPGDALIVVASNVLAKWQTAGRPNGLYRIKMDVYDPSTNTFFPGVNTATILLDNVAPVGLPDDATRPFINITSGGGSCGDFHIGDKIGGSYAVSDDHFYYLTLGLLPTSGTFMAPIPLPRFWTDPGASTNGDAGTWTLDTTGLSPCGYVVVLNAWDRTIVNSGYLGNYNYGSVGFCLKK